MSSTQVLLVMKETERSISNIKKGLVHISTISNGQPYNIVVNPREYLTATTSTTEPTTSAPQTDSPLIWLTNTFFFNGRPTSVFSLPHNPWRSWPPVRGIPPSILQG